MKHETELTVHGDDYSWACTCRKESRHQLPLHLADRNAKAHERKYNKLEAAAPSRGDL